MSEENKPDIREKFKKRKKEKVDFYLSLVGMEFRKINLVNGYQRAFTYPLGKGELIRIVDDGDNDRLFIETDPCMFDNLKYAKGTLYFALSDEDVKKRISYTYSGRILSVYSNTIEFSGVEISSNLKELLTVFEEKRSEYIINAEILKKKEEDAKRLLKRRLTF